MQIQVVVQGIPWAHTDENLAALFLEVGTVEQASVVYSKEGRSRVRHYSGLIPIVLFCAPSLCRS